MREICCAGAPAGVSRRGGGWAAAVGVAFSDALEDAAVVASVVPNSLASDAALHPGDRLVAVDAKHVGSPREAAEMLRQARGAVALTVVEAARVDQDALLASERRRRAAEHFISFRLTKKRSVLFSPPAHDGGMQASLVLAGRRSRWCRWTRCARPLGHARPRRA